MQPACLYPKILKKNSLRWVSTAYGIWIWLLLQHPREQVLNTFINTSSGIKLSTSLEDQRANIHQDVDILNND